MPDSGPRVGAHRAENPHLRGWIVFLWAVVATVVLVVVGIFGTLVVSGKVTLFPTPTPTMTPIPTASPVVDPTVPVLVLNATSVEGLATAVKDSIVAAGWKSDAVSAGQAGTAGYETTTVFYAAAADEGIARGLAQVIGGADVVLSDAYAGQSQRLVVVLGLDRVSPAPTP